MILHLTGCDRDKDNLIYIFELGGIDKANKQKIKRWQDGLSNNEYFDMPDFILDGFFQGLFKYRSEKAEKGINVFNFPGCEKFIKNRG